MMMGQEGTCWEERIHKEEDALKDFMDEWDTTLPEDIERMEAKKRAEEVDASLRRQEAEAREKERAVKEKLAFQKAELEKKLAKLVGWPSHELQNYRVAVI